MNVLEVLARQKAKARELRMKAGAYTEMERILALPESDLTEKAEEYAAKWTALLRAHDGAPPLWPTQGLALEVITRVGNEGTYGILGVGAGKTPIFLLAAEALGIDNAVYLFPAALRKKTEEDLFFWSQHYKFRKPVLMSYESLSSARSTAALRELSPALILADECQALKNPEAARTKRFRRFMKERPDCRFVGMTGSPVNASFMEMFHLMDYALGEGSPVPRVKQDSVNWACVMDPKGEPSPGLVESLSPLTRWAGMHRTDREATRHAFRKRLHSTPGVVTTDSASCRIPLTLEPVIPPLPPRAREYLNGLSSTWELPNGDEVIDASELARAAKQLSLGFYYIWDWEDEPDEDWLKARAAAHKGVRDYLKRYSAEGRDSPALVQKYVRETGRPPLLAAALRVWDLQREKTFLDPLTGEYRSRPPTKAVWVDDEPVRWAVDWARAQGKAVLWFSSRAVGHKLQELGVPALWDGLPKAADTPVVALSIRVFSEGFNLQHDWDTQLVLEPPSSALRWEQLLGRMHRPGQESEKVRCAVYQHTWPLRAALDTAKERALAAYETLGPEQRLLLAEEIVP